LERTLVELETRHGLLPPTTSRSATARSLWLSGVTSLGAPAAILVAAPRLRASALFPDVWHLACTTISHDHLLPGRMSATVPSSPGGVTGTAPVRRIAASSTASAFDPGRCSDGHSSRASAEISRPRNPRLGPASRELAGRWRVGSPR